MNVNWSGEEDKILIEFVRDKEILYNVKHKDYRQTQMKQKLWCEIGELLNKTDFDCYKRWCYVRDYYIRRKGKTGSCSSGEAAKKRSELLSFLDNFSTSLRNSATNVIEVDIPGIHTQDNNEQISTQSLITNDMTFKTEEDNSTDAYNNDSFSAFEIRNPKNDNSKEHSKNFEDFNVEFKKGDTFNTERDSRSDLFNNAGSIFPVEVRNAKNDNNKGYIENVEDIKKEVEEGIKINKKRENSSYAKVRKQRETCNLNELDETDLFFSSMAKIVKKLPRYEQVKLRMEIGSMVGNVELRCIATGSYPNLVSRPSTSSSE